MPGPYDTRQFPGQPLPGTNGNYDIGPMFRNPAGTIPAPTPADMPYSQWQSTPSPLNWTNAGTLDTGYTTVGYWSSPLFDLRPEIRSADGHRPNGVPIWGSATKKLWIQLDGLTTTEAGVVATDNLYPVAREYGNIFNPNNVIRISADSDLGDQIALGTNQPSSIVFPVTPPGSGYNMRYWRFELALRRTDRLTFPLTIWAAFY